MNQGGKDCCRAFIARYQPAEVLQPSVSSLDNPSALVSSELSPILMRRDGVAAAGRNDRLDGSFDQQSARFIAVISPIRNQAFRSATLSPATADASGRTVVSIEARKTTP